MTYQAFSAWLHTVIKSERGAGMVEYALLVAGIAIIAIGAVFLLGGQVQDNFSEITDCLDSPSAAGC
jgi:pilus assembly protein Flp/PilA